MLKHTCVALGSVYCRASHSLVIQDKAELCAQGRDISSGVRWGAGGRWEERMGGEAGGRTKGRLISSKDIILCIREASPAECLSS